MAMSFEEFRSSLHDSQALHGLGLPLTDAEAQQVYADPHASQAWYDYRLATTAAAAETAAAPVAGSEEAAPSEAAPSDAAPSDPATEVLGGHEFAQAAPFAAAPPPAVSSAAAAPPFAAPQGVHPAPESPSAPAPYAGTAPYGLAAPAAPEKKSRVGHWVALSIVGALLLIAIIVVVFAFTTARHWTKVDVPEKPETFHSEEYETGLYLVADDGVSPCVVDQDWTDCISAMEAQYAGACAGVDLVPDAAALCAQHRAEIDRMIAEDSEGSVVASLGDFGHLSRTPETATREVSNNDYEPAVTHEAVCYLGFIGECE